MINTRGMTGIFVIAAVLLAGCTPPGPRSTAPAGTPAAASADDAAAADPSRNTQYVIGPGDQLGISVYRAPELSVPSLPVRPDGRISMPLIPDIVAAGKTPTQLGKELEGRLKEYVKEPIVTVMVTGFVGPFSRQVRVIGEATEPQAIPYRDHMTVLDVMIAVKGLTKFASGNSAIIVRQVGDKRENIKVRLSDLIKDGDIDQNVEMLPGDTLIIPQSWF
jgi:polysaccharide biosynthesis/export protein